MTKKGEVLRISNQGSGIGLTMGSLEFKVFETVCRLGEATVRQVMDEIPEDYAYTTLMTTCDRLAKKGILNRKKDGKGYVYTSVAPREELDAKTTCNVLSKLVESMTEPVMADFLDMLSKQDEKKIEILERLIQERKNVD